MRHAPGRAPGPAAPARARPCCLGTQHAAPGLLTFSSDFTGPFWGFRLPGQGLFVSQQGPQGPHALGNPCKGCVSHHGLLPHTIYMTYPLRRGCKGWALACRGRTVGCKQIDCSASHGGTTCPHLCWWSQLSLVAYAAQDGLFLLGPGPEFESQDGSMQVQAWHHQLAKP